MVTFTTVNSIQRFSLISLDPSNYFVVLGNSNITEVRHLARNQDILLHPQFNYDKFDNDIAILKNMPVTYTSVI